MITLEDNLSQVQNRLQQAAERGGRRGQDITLIAVTKYVSVEQAVALKSLGVEDFGENRLPEASQKQVALDPARVHFIGHLQTNKVNKVVGAFHSIHSLDRPSLLEAVEKRAAALGCVQKGFVQVNVSGELSKGGVAPSELGALLKQSESCEHIEVEGLMTMAPLIDQPDQLRKNFRYLKILADEHGLEGLSMGMSRDFEIAVEEGATHIRVGSVLFEGT